MDKLLDRFCRYVKIETTADEDSQDYPSTPGQLVLGRTLLEELKELGLKAEMDESGIVMATVPGTVEAPTIAWLAHLDTSPEESGLGVNPIVHRDYDGGELVLPGDPSQVLRPSEIEELAGLKGKTLITSDGTTLLGADDKAGVAVVVTAAAELLKKEVAHGPIRLVFTCDEEIGRGTDKLDLNKIAAVAAYTLDGEGSGSIENETFSADAATVTFRGRNIHPGLACGKMVNALRAAGTFLDRLPREQSPEKTSGRQPFIHPYTFEGGVETATLRCILRSFDTADLEKQAARLRALATEVEEEHPQVKVEVETRFQYRNMREFLEQEPRAVDLAAQAFRNLGRRVSFSSIRGGTDGSRLSEMGLPTPNLSTGMHNFHSKKEFACLEEMQEAVEVLLELARLWGQEKDL